MNVLMVHPGPLMYTKIYLRLEPLGLELVAQAARQAGHQVRLIDLQVETQRDYLRLLREWRPDVIGISCNYLANVPEVIDLAKETKQTLPHCGVFVGGHSASFVSRDVLHHGGGAIDCVLKGEGERGVVRLLSAFEHDRRGLATVPGCVTLEGEGPAPEFVDNLDDLRPARDLVRHRRNYFIGVLDPARPSNSREGAPGIVPSAAPGLFTAGATAPSTPSASSTILNGSKSPASLSSTMWRSFKPTMAWPSAPPSPSEGSRNSITWRRAATSCFATKTCSGTGRSSA